MQFQFEFSRQNLQNPSVFFVFQFEFSRQIRENSE